MNKLLLLTTGLIICLIPPSKRTNRKTPASKPVVGGFLRWIYGRMWRLCMESTRRFRSGWKVGGRGGMACI